MVAGRASLAVEQAIIALFGDGIEVLGSEAILTAGIEFKTESSFAGGALL